MRAMYIHYVREATIYPSILIEVFSKLWVHCRRYAAGRSRSCYRITELKCLQQFFVCVCPKHLAQAVTPG